MAKKKTIREEILERWEINPPTWADVMQATEDHIAHLERDNARLQRRVDKLKAENEKLKEEATDAGLAVVRQVRRNGMRLGR